MIFRKYSRGARPTSVGDEALWLVCDRGRVRGYNVAWAET